MQVVGGGYVELVGHHSGFKSLLQRIVRVLSALYPAGTDVEQRIVLGEYTVRIEVPHVALVVVNACGAQSADGQAHVAVFLSLVDGEHLAAVFSVFAHTGHARHVHADKAVELFKLYPLVDLGIVAGNRNALLLKLGIHGVAGLVGFLKQRDDGAVVGDRLGDFHADLIQQGLVEAGGIHLHGVLHGRNGIDAAVDLHGLEEVFAHELSGLGGVLEQLVHGGEGALLSPLDEVELAVDVHDVIARAGGEDRHHLLAVLGGVDEVEVDLGVDLFDQIFVDGVKDLLVAGQRAFKHVPVQLHIGQVIFRGYAYGHAHYHAQCHKQAENSTHKYVPPLSIFTILSRLTHKAAHVHISPLPSLSSVPV